MKKVFFIIALTVLFLSTCFYRVAGRVEYFDAGRAVIIDTTGNIWELPAAGLNKNDIITFYNFNMLTAGKHNDVTLIHTIRINNSIDFEY